MAFLVISPHHGVAQSCSKSDVSKSIVSSSDILFFFAIIYHPIAALMLCWRRLWLLSKILCWVCCMDTANCTSLTNFPDIFGKCRSSYNICSFSSVKPINRGRSLSQYNNGGRTSSHSLNPIILFHMFFTLGHKNGCEWIQPFIAFIISCMISWSHV